MEVIYIVKRKSLYTLLMDGKLDKKDRYTPTLLFTSRLKADEYIEECKIKDKSESELLSFSDPDFINLVCKYEINEVKLFDGNSIY